MSIVCDFQAVHRLTCCCSLILWRWQGCSSESSEMWSVFCHRMRKHRRTTFMRSSAPGHTLVVVLVSKGSRSKVFAPKLFSLPAAIEAFQNKRI